ncbi:MAG TPA: histidinol dehydrogenase [Candidatus Acidoferrales bacterium]
MRLLKLTRTVENKILAARRTGDAGAMRAAARIVADVRRGGDAAVLSWSNRFDSTELRAPNLWVSTKEMRNARSEVTPAFRAAIEAAARNIRRVAERQKPKEWTFEVEAGVRISQIVRPIESIACYAPGGRFSLVSTLLMTVIPAQVAGVPEIIVASPRPGAAFLAAAEMLGVRRVLRVGGTQAIAALAYGTRMIPRVDKIFGPGNRYVTAAKQLISADCAIDMLAGPTEALFLASRGNPRFIAADLLAQAEHDPEAISMLVTTSARFATAVAQEIAAQLNRLPADSAAHRSIRKNGAILVAPGLAEAIDFVNRFAPEHLTVEAGGAEMLRRIHAAGSIFLGDWSAQAFGDYASGTNHVLPTRGLARARGGLSVADFVKCITVQEVTRVAARRLVPVAEKFAAAEGLVAHGRSVEVRR